MAPQPASENKADSPKQPQASPAASMVAGLPQVKRIFVDSFGDDTISKQIQAMVVTSLTDSKRFIVTENKDRADAFLRGTGLEKTSQEVHAYKDSTAAGAASGGFTATDGNASGGFAGSSAAISDSSLNTETVNDARIAVRLVNRDGDVIWATTQESKGAKYKGASADVADMVVKQLLRAAERAEKKETDSKPSPTN
ncbi:MAG TPA: CsgG/HfaB family protein [Terriglobales bacterium]|nr:CsgG/HfaB family protein [Terriglobales bacterium]